MKTLFPYKTLFGDVAVMIEEVAIDDTLVRDRVDHDQRTIDLHGIEREEWESARITLSMTGPPSEISEVDNPAAVILANCGPSNHRASATLRSDPDSAGRWIGELIFERPFWYAHAELRGGVVAKVDGEDNRIIGWANPWTIRFDDLPDRPVNGAIKISWIDFKNPGSDHAFLERYVDQYVYLSIDPDEPQLYLNRAFDGLVQLLEKRRPRRVERALHDQTRASIAEMAWTSLFDAAMNAIEINEDTGEPAWPSSDWQRTVLENLFGHMYPDKSTDEALRDAWTARTTPESAGVLQEVLAPAVAIQARAPSLLRGGIRSISDHLESDGEDGAE
ncbi:MAG: hypothetical protein R2706_20685 [Acidimicrobiales bacterium]